MRPDGVSIRLHSTVQYYIVCRKKEGKSKVMAHLFVCVGRFLIPDHPCMPSAAELQSVLGLDSNSITVGCKRCHGCAA
jgi:hypothetical protein